MIFSANEMQDIKTRLLKMSKAEGNRNVRYIINGYEFIYFPIIANGDCHVFEVGMAHKGTFHTERLNNNHFTKGI
ncbi:hypothetical protein LCGC14_2542670 [marine sediment metagenome]|uniref:Uncharacterized protein n=1 Tax=marine sediment metagenome TaxID=412755 RepID=A0A0F9AQA8_9ZZZZ